MTEQELRDNTYWEYQIRVTGNLFSGALATSNFSHRFELAARRVMDRAAWYDVIYKTVGGDYSKIIDFEVLELEKVCVVHQAIDWEFEDSEINYEMINNPEEDE